MGAIVVVALILLVGHAAAKAKAAVPQGTIALPLNDAISPTGAVGRLSPADFNGNPAINSTYRTALTVNSKNVATVRDPMMGLKGIPLPLVPQGARITSFAPRSQNKMLSTLQRPPQAITVAPRSAMNLAKPAPSRTLIKIS